MSNDDRVFIQFTSAPGEPQDQDLIQRLAHDVTDSQLGLVTFEHEIPADNTRPGTGLIEWAAVALSAGYLLRDVLRIAVDWAKAAKNPVRVRIGPCEIEISDPTDEEQAALIAAFVAKHGPH